MSIKETVYYHNGRELGTDPIEVYRPRRIGGPFLYDGAWYVVVKDWINFTAGRYEVHLLTLEEAGGRA